jgi:hypothetical protein
MSIADNEWDLIVNGINDGTCTPFLGAGASLGAGIPTAETVATELAAKCNYPLADRRDFLRVCQYYSMVNGRGQVQSEVAKRIRAVITPGFVHNVLAALPFSIVLTTNFDKLMELAFTRAGKEQQVATYRISGDRVRYFGVKLPTPSRPLVYKLHGDVDDQVSMLITEDDVIGFLAGVLLRDPPLPEQIEMIFRSNSLLFIGYSLKDWNIRVLLRALRGNDSGMHSFAIQKRPSRAAVAKEWEATVMHLRKGSLYCYDMDAIEFANTLYETFNARYPARTIPLQPS